MTTGSPAEPMDMAESGMHRIVRIAVRPGMARAIIIDDFHHFRIGLRHDGQAVTALCSRAVRYPYSLCPASGEALDALVGLPLSRRIFDVSAAINARQQCTHQFDLAAQLVTAAARGQARGYDILVTDPHEGRCTARLTRDDGFAMGWAIEGMAIIGPDNHAGVALDQGFTAWAASLPDEDSAEAALALRRAHMVLRGRTRLEELNRRLFAPTRGSCYVMQPERAMLSERIPTPFRDGLTPPEPDAEDLAWLAGEAS